MTFTDIDTAIEALENVGIESGVQHTYFGDEVYVHLYGNNRPAMIYPSIEMFMGWVNAVGLDSLKQENYFSDECECEYDDEC